MDCTTLLSDMRQAVVASGEGAEGIQEGRGVSVCVGVQCVSGWKQVFWAEIMA